MPEVTTTIDKVEDKPIKNGSETIFIAHAGGKEYNTKHFGMAKTLKEAAGSGANVNIEFTVLPGRPKDGGGAWPDSLWIDKDGVTVVEGSSSSAPRSSGGGGNGDWSPDAQERAARHTAWKGACMTVKPIEVPIDKLPATLKTIADYGVDFIGGRLGAPKTAEDALAAAADDIPF